jgi:hypothetical protein
MMMGMTGIIRHRLLLRIGGLRISGIGIGRILLRGSRNKAAVVEIAACGRRKAWRMLEIMLEIERAAYVW